MLTFDFALYISLWFYSNASRRSAFQRFQRFLYIPLWFYSNYRSDQQYHPYNKTFTFHYGSIQIVTVAVSNHTLFNFTFHYGSIQIRAWGSRSGDNLPLHSTMVLFKSHAEGPLPRSYNSLHSTMVLFKSFPYPVAALFLHLYIPLWFYSNVFADRTLDIAHDTTLHSTMVLFK